MIRVVNLTYDDLRKLVIACHNQGLFLKRPGLTFSHGNVGNEYMALAKKVDTLVQNSEPYHLFLLSHNGELPKKKDEVEYEWQVFHDQDDNIMANYNRHSTQPNTEPVRSDATGQAEPASTPGNHKRTGQKKSSRDRLRRTKSSS